MVDPNQPLPRDNVVVASFYTAWARLAELLQPASCLTNVNGMGTGTNRALPSLSSSGDTGLQVYALATPVAVDDALVHTVVACVPPLVAFSSVSPAVVLVNVHVVELLRGENVGGTVEGNGA